SATLRSARTRGAAARSRVISAGADRRAAPAAASTARRSRRGGFRARLRVPAGAERGVPPFLFSLQRDAADRRRNLTVRFGGKRGSARRSGQTNPRHGAGNTLLRTSDEIVLGPWFFVPGPCLLLGRPWCLVVLSAWSLVSGPFHDQGQGRRTRDD